MVAILFLKLKKDHQTGQYSCLVVQSVWKTVPSEARVTRAEVSEFQTKAKRLSGRQYHHKHQ